MSPTVNKKTSCSRSLGRSIVDDLDSSQAWYLVLSIHVRDYGLYDCILESMIHDLLTQDVHVRETLEDAFFWEVWGNVTRVQPLTVSLEDVGLLVG
jgi:hypothetical protein